MSPAEWALASGITSGVFMTIMALLGLWWLCEDEDANPAFFQYWMGVAAAPAFVFGMIAIWTGVAA